ncbi:hypothetical protein ABZW02_20235 [Streptomyces sp. NPDC005180]|uniref:hypothetical protein n=1 Tax=Streptomyces sp. NPDC005180 TaxID=3156868 RepID=UPI0033AEFF34
MTEQRYTPGETHLAFRLYELGQEHIKKAMTYKWAAESLHVEVNASLYHAASLVRHLAAEDGNHLSNTVHDPFDNTHKMFMLLAGDEAGLSFSPLKRQEERIKRLGTNLLRDAVWVERNAVDPAQREQAAEMLGRYAPVFGGSDG